MIWGFNSWVHVETMPPWVLQIFLEVYNHTLEGQ